MLFNEPSYYINGHLFLDEFNQLAANFAEQPNQPPHDWQKEELLIMTYNLWVRLIEVEKIRIPNAQYQMLFPLIFDIHNFIDNHELTKRFKMKHSQNELLFYYAIFISAELSNIFKSLAPQDVFAQSNELKQFIGKEEYFFTEPKYQKLLQARRMFYQRFYHDQKLQAQFDYHVYIAFKNACDFISTTQTLID